MSGYIYFLESPALKAVKIGFTKSNPERRASNLQTGSADRLTLLKAVEGCRDQEQILHDVFSPLRLHGEWFRLDQKLECLAWYLIGQLDCDVVPGSRWPEIKEVILDPPLPFTEQHYEPMYSASIDPRWVSHL